MRTLLYLSIILVILSTVMASADDAKWNMVWQDNFDRSDVGSDWWLVDGKLSIQNGRLLLEGGGATVLAERTVKPDVRFEFDAEAMPGLPPCDLSAALGANKVHGYGYLLAFGGQSNQANQLLGRGVRVVDKNPKFVIEHGKKYHIVAQQEGKRITYTVNGTKILDGVTTDLAAGPGFDRIGLVTWAGMYVDNFKLYERETPHPDTPDYPTALPETSLYRDGKELKIRAGSETKALQDAVDAFNKGDLNRALQMFKAMGNTANGLIGQAYVIGDLYYDEKLQFYPKGRTETFEKLATDFRKALKANPNDKILQAYSKAADSLPELIMNRSGMTAAIRLVALGPENNPFYYKARMYEARYYYWNGAEGGNAKIKNEACSWMADLKKTWAENIVLKQYSGESVPWGMELKADTTQHPAWAAYLREAYTRQIRIMERFFKERQAPDGQLGGGYGDDVELMRTWMQIASISSAAESVRTGIECLADGVWKYELVNGYAKDIGDIEHSAEPSADTIPTMLLIRYGDPLWVERNLQSCKIIHDEFMGIDKKGYPRFKSVEFGAKGVNTHPRAGGDTGYHARAMKHFIWQAWWGDPESRDWFAGWCDGWRAATLAKIGTKMPGTCPPTIWYPSGDIQPPVDAPWYDKGWNYYGNMGGMVYDSFLCAYYLTKDPKFLKVFQFAMDQATYGPLDGDGLAPDSPEGQRKGLAHMPDAQKTATYKWLTGERVYDEYTKRFREPSHLYRINYDLDAYLNSFERTARNLRHNLEFETTEVLSTDRAGLGNALTVFGAYTGAVCGLRDAATPTFAVTYDTPDTDFAALVTESTSNRLRVWLYSFHEKPVKMGLKFWQLVPGSYILNQGELVDGENPSQYRYHWINPGKVKLIHRAEPVSVTVPGKKVWVVDIRLDEPISVPSTAPDLAVTSRDLKWTDKGLQVTIHNIGNARSKEAVLALRPVSQGSPSKSWTVTVPSLPAPSNFNASTNTVVIRVNKSALPAGSYKISIDPEGKQYELCETNNACVVGR